MGKFFIQASFYSISMDTKLSCFHRISERFGAMLRAFASFIIGILMALGMAWRLALVLIATMVPLALVTWFSGRVVSKATQDVQDSSAQASGIAEQVFAGICTVYSFSLQGRFSRLYDEKLVNARKDGERRALIAGGMCTCKPY